jgi:16S rRNA processing protein RimM
MKWIPVGNVVSTHGLKGEVKFRYYNEIKEDFLRYASLFIIEHNRVTELKPTGKRLQKGFFYIKFEGFESPDEVFYLLNKELFVREEDLPQPGKDEYYDYQLVGLDVVNQRDEKIGKVEAILHTKANDIIVVTGKEETFIPMFEDNISEIDLEGSSIRIRENVLTK